MIEKQVFIEKIKKVGGMLGYTVEFLDERSSNQAKLTNNDITIHIRTGGWQLENKIKVYGSYPHDCHNQSYSHGLKNPSICCSQDKSAEQIIRDIQRRFLPDYLEDLQKVKETNKNIQECANANYHAIKTLADSLSIKPIKDYKDEYSLPIWGVLQGLSSLEVSYDGTRIDLKLELTLEQTLQILTILKSWK